MGCFNIKNVIVKKKGFKMFYITYLNTKKGEIELCYIKHKITNKPKRNHTKTIEKN